MSIVLGGAALAAIVGLLHDNGAREKAATLVAATTAQQLADAARERLPADLSTDAARQSAHDVFSEIIRQKRTLAYLDSASVRVTRADGTPLFGALAADHDIHGAVHDDRMTVDVALTVRQIPHVLLVPVRHTAVFHVFLLFGATAVVTSLAFVSARREAELAGARADFIAGVSHDLRMPLAQILLAGETLTLRHDLSGDEKSSLAHSVVRESRRLIGLVENILLFSRSGASALRPRRDVVIARELLEETVEAARLAADDAGQSLHIAAAPELSFVGDARLLRQALVNLVDNALKYGPRGQRVTLGAERVNESVRLTVDDQGPGVPLADRNRMFEAYERLARDESSERTGSGLGLTVVAYIVNASGGRVRLEDAPGGGTRAVLELPA